MLSQDAATRSPNLQNPLARENHPLSYDYLSVAVTGEPLRCVNRMRAKASAMRWPSSARAAPAISAGSLDYVARIQPASVNRHAIAVAIAHSI